jgi:hypothetical protein
VSDDGKNNSMKKDSNRAPHSESDNAEKNDPEAYKSYPVSEDIYNKFKEEAELDPEDLSKVKQKIQATPESDIEIDFNSDATGSDLDVPGSELDDQQEIDGNEDEENNYYSLGGDDHNNLDEDKDGM